MCKHSKSFCKQANFNIPKHDKIKVSSLSVVEGPLCTKGNLSLILASKSLKSVIYYLKAFPWALYLLSCSSRISFLKHLFSVNWLEESERPRRQQKSPFSGTKGPLDCSARLQDLFLKGKHFSLQVLWGCKKREKRRRGVEGNMLSVCSEMKICFSLWCFSREITFALNQPSVRRFFDREIEMLLSSSLFGFLPSLPQKKLSTELSTQRSLQK